MKARLIIGFLILFRCVSAQPPGIEWQKCLGGMSHDWASSIQQTTDGGYIVGGSTCSGDIAGYHPGDPTECVPDMWIVKLNSTGSITWQKCLGGSAFDWAESIQETSDGGFIVTGAAESNDGDVTNNHGMWDFWVVKLSSSGNIQWQKCLGGSNEDYGSSIHETSDGGFIVTGSTHSNDGDVSGNHGNEDVWVVKLTSSGNIVWQKCLGGSAFDRGSSITQTSDGGFIVAGRAQSNDGDVSGNHGSYDSWVVKLNSTGSITWQKCLGGSGLDEGNSIQQTSDGGFIIAGRTQSNDGDVSGNHGSLDEWVVKLNSTGTIVWQKCLGGSNIEWGESVQETPDGGYVVAGSTHSNDGDVSGNHGSSEYWVVKLNVTGNLEWQKCMGGSFEDQSYSIDLTTDGGFIVGGSSNSNNGDVSGNHGSEDFWVVKLGSGPGCPALNPTSSITNPDCIGSANGSININPPTNGTLPYSYDWSNGASTEDVSNLSAGSYSLTITDANSCESIFSFILVNPPAILLSLTSQSISCFGAADGVITANPSGGSPGYTYEWSNGATSNTISGLTAGLYSVTVTDDHDCTTSTSTLITEPSPLNLNVVGQNIACYGVANGSATAIPSGGTPVYQYTWSNGANGNVINNLPAGIYEVTVTDNHGCQQTNSIEITQPPLLTVSLSSIGVTCFGDANGSANATAGGGTPAYTYLWSNGANTASIQNLPAGAYALTITDANGCTQANSVMVATPPALIANITGQPVSCFGSSDGSASVSMQGGTPGYSYLWSNGSSASSIINVTAGNYSLTVTDTIGCTISDSYTIESPELLEVYVSVTDVTAPGAADGSATADVSGGTPGYLYEWSTGETTISITDLTEGIYSLTITDEHGCTEEIFFTISSSGCALSANVVVIPVSCFGESNGEATAQFAGASGNVEFQWSTGASTQSINDLSPGVYFLTVSDGSCIAYTFGEINEPPAIVAQVTTAPSMCNASTGSASVLASGGTGTLSYVWSNGETSSIIDSLSAGTYALTVSDINGCSSESTITISAIDINIPQIVEAEDSLYVTGTGEIDFTPIADNFIDDCSSISIVVLNEDSISCSGSGGDTIQINISDEAGNDTVYALLVYILDTFPPEAVSCPSDINQGTCQGAVVFDPPVFSDNCQITSEIQIAGLPSGSIFPVGITINEWLVTDAHANTNLCSQVITITEGIVLQSEVQPITCHNQDDGAVTLDTTGLHPPYTILWSTGDTTSSLQNLGEGMYTVTATDGNGCFVMDTFTMMNPDFLMASLLEIQDASSADTNDGYLVIEVSGGTPPYAYQWYQGDSLVSTMQNPTNLGPGGIVLFLSDAHQCLFIGLSAKIGIMVSLEQVENAGLKVWPNPGDGLIHIEAPGIIQTVLLYDMSGRLIETYPGGSLKSMQLNIQDELQGMYALVVLHENGESETTRIMIVESNE